MLNRRKAPRFSIQNSAFSIALRQFDAVEAAGPGEPEGALAVAPHGVAGAFGEGFFVVVAFGGELALGVHSEMAEAGAGVNPVGAGLFFDDGGVFGEGVLGGLQASS